MLSELRGAGEAEVAEGFEELRELRSWGDCEDTVALVLTESH